MALHRFQIEALETLSKTDGVTLNHAIQQWEDRHEPAKRMARELLPGLIEDAGHIREKLKKTLSPKTPSKYPPQVQEALSIRKIPSVTLARAREALSRLFDNNQLSVFSKFQGIREAVKRGPEELQPENVPLTQGGHSSAHPLEASHGTEDDGLNEETEAESAQPDAESEIQERLISIAEIEDVPEQRLAVQQAFGAIFEAIKESRLSPDSQWTKEEIERRLFIHGKDWDIEKDLISILLRKAYLAIGPRALPWKKETISLKQISDALKSSEEALNKKGSPYSRYYLDLIPKILGWTDQEYAEMLGRWSDAKGTKDFTGEDWLKSKKLQECFDLLEKMREDYSKELDRLEFYELVDENAQIPTFPQIMATFTPEMLRNVIDEKFQEPKLILVPPVPFWNSDKTKKSLTQTIEKEARMAKISFPNLISSYSLRVSPEYHEEIQPKKWQVFLVDGIVKLDKGFEVVNLDEAAHPKYFREKITDRLKNINQLYERTSIRFLDRWLSANLLMSGMIEGKPIDQDCLVILASDPILSEFNMLPYFDFSQSTPHSTFTFGTLPSDHVYLPARFRRSVGGEVKM